VPVRVVELPKIDYVRLLDPCRNRQQTGQNSLVLGQAPMIRRADFSHRSRVVDHQCHVDVSIPEGGRLDAENDVSTARFSADKYGQPPNGQFGARVAMGLFSFDKNLQAPPFDIEFVEREGA
jgi:hypothetical protein